MNEELQKIQREKQELALRLQQIEQQRNEIITRLIELQGIEKYLQQNSNQKEEKKEIK